MGGGSVTRHVELALREILGDCGSTLYQKVRLGEAGGGRRRRRQAEAGGGGSRRRRATTSNVR